MNIKTPVIVSIVILLAIVGFYFYQKGNGSVYKQANTGSEESLSLADSPQNATYFIDGGLITLYDGNFELQAGVGAAVSDIGTDGISIFGQLIFGDINGDGFDDGILFLVKNSEGVQTYYVAAALNINGGYEGTSALLLGENILPQSLEIQNGVVVANYLGDPDLSTAFSFRAQIENGDLVEIRSAENTTE